MISASELAAMQDTQIRAMQDTATIESERTISDNRGGQLRRFVETATDVPARLAQPSQRERSSVSDRFKTESVYVLTFPAGTAIEAGDRIIMEAGVFEVLGVNEPESYNTAIRVFVRATDG